jgi:hypothetical protein
MAKWCDSFRPEASHLRKLRKKAKRLLKKAAGGMTNDTKISDQVSYEDLVVGSSTREKEPSATCFPPASSAASIRSRLVAGSPVSRRFANPRAHGDSVVCEAPKGNAIAIPAWMTDKGVCAGFSLGSPVVSPAACFRRSN